MLQNAALRPAESVVFGFLLIDAFALMSYASIIEPFRAANVLSGKELYRWINVSIDGKPVRASNGATIAADAKIGDAMAIDTLFVVAGGNPSEFGDRATLAWLHRLARSDVRLAGISGGPLVLAKAGVLDGYRCTIHWDYSHALEEQFPTLLLERVLYVIDRGRITCAGGTAGLDLAVELIERDHGHSLGIQVGEWFIRTQPRPASGDQRINLRERYGIRNDAVIMALARMEAKVEEPEQRESLARRVGLSVRQLDRLFSRHLGCSITEANLRIRLEHAEMLLRNTGMTVTDVGIACGFTSSSHFSRSFKAKYGKPPSA